MQNVSETVDSEEEIIARTFAPLVAQSPGALGLSDDCALLAPPSGETLVVTVDAVAEGVHFLPAATPEDIAWRALAVNVSDLAGKGATPLGYVLAISFPAAPTRAWLERLSAGLKVAQEAFGIALLGGDTDRRPGPLTLTITAFGSVPEGTMVRRSTAKPGDRIFVTGTLGDAMLGLALEHDGSRAGAWGLSGPEQNVLRQRLLRPEPRLAMRNVLRQWASASMDLSDGLIKDAARLCRASGVSAAIEADALPLSPTARRVIAKEPALHGAVAGGGDDYELLITVPEHLAGTFAVAAANCGTMVTSIGRIGEGHGVRLLDSGGRDIPVRHQGWDHFKKSE